MRSNPRPNAKQSNFNFDPSSNDKQPAIVANIQSAYDSQDQVNKDYNFDNQAAKDNAQLKQPHAENPNMS